MAQASNPVIRGRWIILALFAALCAWLVPGAFTLQHDDDVLAFLPPEHPDVVAFRDVADRFGMLEVALVGVTDDDEDLLRPEPMEQLRTLHTKLTEIDGVRLVLSLPDFPDAKVVNETLVVDKLVPESADTAEVIRQRVMANTDAVGNVVSRDGKAAAFLIFLKTDNSDEHVANRGRILSEVRAAVDEQWSGQSFFGGSPFIEHVASESSRSDIEKLSPIVIGVLVIVSAVLLGSTTAAILNLIVTGLGVALIVGAHGRFGEPFTIVSSTTPVMMVALGGAFGMHVLAGYQRAEGTPQHRADVTLRELWLPVVLSGLTTATAFFALVVMPQQPMQRFGVVAGIGVLLLLVLALLVLPALLAVLPANLLPTRPNRRLPRPPAPHPAVLALLALAGLWGASRMAADPDTGNVFSEESEPRRANLFFEEHFGGSQYLQIAIDADLYQPAVLRRIRTLGEAVAQVDGVADVRSLIDPVAMITEGFGGRRGIPSTHGRTKTVVMNLADHPAAAQLMLSTADGAIVHVKLVPGDSASLVRVTGEVREIVESLSSSPIREGPADQPEVAAARKQEVLRRVRLLSGQDVDEARLDTLLSAGGSMKERLATVEQLRARAFGTDELVKPLPAAVYERLDVKTLLETRGPALEKYITDTLPELVQSDPKGIPFAAEYLGDWIDEETNTGSLETACTELGLPAPPPPDPDADPAEAPPTPARSPEEQAGLRRCAELVATLQELDDETWTIPDGVDAEATAEHSWASTFTGQPVIGQAFAESVTSSLRASTLVSIAALSLVLLVARQLRALIPATWTVAVTGGVIWLLGHPISIGTSMVSCIALGAGVDFAIHLGIRARAIGGDAPGEAATDELGGVVGMAGLQLAMAFSVLLASSMPPLRQFGVGLAIGLLLAAIGSVWLTPRLYRKT